LDLARFAALVLMRLLSPGFAWSGAVNQSHAAT
jgi:hypothetical protein